MPCRTWFLLALAALPASGEPAAAPKLASPADVIAATCDPVLADLLRDVLASSPALAAEAARSVASAARVAGAGVLPDPMLQVRTTTDRGGASWSDTTDVEVMGMQPLPPRGRRRAAVAEAQSRASAAATVVDAARLDALAEASRWYYELARLDALEELRRDELATLRAFAETARGRYGSGAGRQHDALRAQAEVARGELMLVEIDSRRREALAALNELRGRAPHEGLRPSALPVPSAQGIAFEGLDEQVAIRSPAVAAARSEIDAARGAEAVARTAHVPDIALGGFYEFMDPGDGGSLEHDEFGVVVGISLPIRKRRIVAGIDEAVALRLASVEQERAARASLQRRTTDSLTRAREARETWDLQAQVLGLQADESLRSALSGYSTGEATSLEVIDSLRVAYDVRAMALRAQADLAMAEAMLRSLVGGALPGEAPCQAVVAPRAAAGDAPAPETTAPPTDASRRRRARLPRW